ncbi:MAG TPA: hypothetical protein VJU18_10940 [Vicinamibacteria bacterium]|nr:hypothetical protein [Vicinamibacteria bacterium]
MNKRLAALPLAVLATFGPAQAQATHSQRFHGNGVAAPTLDRVVIRLDAPARPVDVGAGDLTLEFWMKANPGDNTTTPCSGGEDDWINGSIILDRDIFGALGCGDFGVSLMDRGVTFGVAGAGGGNTVCGAGNLADGACHVAVTRSLTSGQLRVFVDGLPDGSAPGPTGNLSYLDGRPTAHPYDSFLRRRLRGLTQDLEARALAPHESRGGGAIKRHCVGDA